MSYIIYLLLCIINGVVLAAVDITPTRWQFWVVTFCVVGAYLCGCANKS